MEDVVSPMDRDGRGVESVVVGEGGKSLLESASRLPVVGLLVRALRKSRDHQTRDMAASTAYFSFFSLFPLLLGVIAGGSFFLDSEEIRGYLDGILTDTLPGSARPLWRTT